MGLRFIAKFNESIKLGSNGINLNRGTVAALGSTEISDPV